MGGDSGAETPVSVTIRCSNGSKFPVLVALASTVSSFKELVAAACDVPAEQQRLIYKGRILKDAETLASYGVESDHTIHLVRGAAPSSVSNAPPRSDVGESRNQSSTHADENARGLGSNAGGGFSGGHDSLFPGLGNFGMGGATGLAGAGLPDFDQLHQQLSQNPNMMGDVMNMPFVQNLLNNPEMLRNFISSSPQMREILDRNPELSHILNDPNTLRQAVEATRNPGLMREMMRNTDRAMSNIESLPEGFNMLRRMYETVQEPFLNATAMAGQAGNGRGLTVQSTDSSDIPTNTVLESTPAPNTNPLPNPWSNTAGAQTNNARQPSAVDGRAPGGAGLAGLGLPEFQGNTQDSSLFSQVLQNPAMAQMMQSLLSNPQYVNHMISSHPLTRNMMENNPQLREMLQNPDFLRQMASPDTLRQMLTLQQSLSSLGLQQPGRDQTERGVSGAGTFNSTSMDQLARIFSELGAGNVGIPNVSNAPPEELYATQLTQLQEMGFFDTQENIRALVATAGNVHAAVERLLGNLGQ